MEPPNPGQILRRRKKRSSVGLISGGPGSSLTGLSRNSIRVVELLRKSTGYGFTISGQKPCLLRSIIDGSPASLAGLRRGHCLVGVNGRDVTHLAHDEVVRIIGNCTGLLRLHVAESYFSESSDDESFPKESHPRPRYSHHRPRGLSKTSLGSAKRYSQSHSPLANQREDPESTGASNSTNEIRASTPFVLDSLPRSGQSTNSSSWSVYDSGVRKPPVPFKNSDISYNRNTSNPRVETVRVFENLDELFTLGTTKTSSEGKFQSDIMSNERFSTHSSSGSGSRKRFPKISQRSVNSSEFENGPIYQAVVGYVGSMELPEIKEDKRHETLSECIRIFRKQKTCLKHRSVVLLRIQPTGISVFGSYQNAQKDPPITFYPPRMISFCGAASDDRRFFGLVTCSDTSSPNTSSSCHVFMLEPKLLSHSTHAVRAEYFGINCTRLPLPKTGHVLGLQECDEFPGTADPILSSIVHLHPASCQQVEEVEQKQRPPSEASVRHESTTTSSNSDSGIGFRDDSDRLSGKIYDIVDPESVSFEIKRIQHHSPVPKKKLPIPGNRKIISSARPTALRLSKISPRGNIGHHPPTPTIMKSMSSRCHLLQPPSSFYEATDGDFQEDLNSMKEILEGCNRNSSKPPIPNRPSHSASGTSRDRLTLNSRGPPTRKQFPELDKEPPRPIEVSVLITPPRKTGKRDKRRSMGLMKPISPSEYGHHENEGRLNSSALYPIHRVSCGSRSLDNLCSPEVIEDFEGGVTDRNRMELKGNIGSSTPALNHDAMKQSGDEFWEFKVPEAPKPKSGMSRVEQWAESIEKLLSDSTGMEVFTEFLEHEFSAENIHFYTACLRFKDSYADLTPSQKISVASTIFQRHLQNGATDPINVDHQARNQVEKALPQPTLEMFDLPLAQVFNLLKFDCYPRFLKSDMYRDYLNGRVSVVHSLGEASDSDTDSVKSQSKLNSDGRRRSLLPWNIRNRSKNKNRNKNEVGLNSDMSFIQKTALNQNYEGSDQDDELRRQSYKLCRVVLPDNSTTVLPCKPGESLSTVVTRLLEKREFNYSAFEVLSVASGKPMDLNTEVSGITAREIKVEPRAFVGIELPLGWKVGIRANPLRKVAEVLKPILTQHSLKLDNIVVHDLETGENVDLKCPVGKIDGHNINVQTKGGETKLEEFNNQVEEFRPGESYPFDEDQLSAKTSSSHSSSVFRDFLRRSSKKYRKEKQSKASAPSGSVVCKKGDSKKQDMKKPLPPQEAFKKSKSGDRVPFPPKFTSTCQNNSAISKSATSLTTGVPKSSMTTTANDNHNGSPLSLISCELNLVENSRNRKPIYMNQSVEQTRP